MMISPAKTLDEKRVAGLAHSLPRMQAEAVELAAVMRKKSAGQLRKLMHISDKLAVQNVERFRDFAEVSTVENAKQALLMFKGDVYQGIHPADFDEQDLQFAQTHLRILSGMYGLLRPLDLIQPYRLEMGTALRTRSFRGLYKFWGDKITGLLKQDMDAIETRDLVNLASKEYFEALHPEAIPARVVHIHFRELRDGELKFISYNAKRSRGWMVRYAIKNRLTQPEQLQSFDLEGYRFRPELSDANNWHFVRELDA